MKTSIRTLFVLFSLCIGLISARLAFAFDLSTVTGDTWQEEVLLHDGTVIIVKRTQTYKGLHVIGEETPEGDVFADFSLPKTGKHYRWKSEFAEDIGRTNFNLLAIHVSDGVPFIVAEPNLCLSYNKWDRPNPPYILFKWNESNWQQITIEELPKEFLTLNVLNSPNKADKKSGAPISAATIAERNSSLPQQFYKTLVREPTNDAGCGRLVRYKCGWGEPGEFSRKYFEKICK